MRSRGKAIMRMMTMLTMMAMMLMVVVMMVLSRMIRILPSRSGSFLGGLPKEFPDLAFVGLYRGPYFAVMELQVRRTSCSCQDTKKSQT